MEQHEETTTRDALGGAFAGLGAEFKRQRAEHRRKVRRAAIAGFLAFAIFGAFAGLGTWEGRISLILAIAAAASAARAVIHLRRN